MATRYLPFRVALTEGQKRNLFKAVKAKTTASFRLKPENIGKGDEITLTPSQINRLKKAAAKSKGVDLVLSKSQITKNYQIGGNLLTTALSLARPLLAPAAKAAGKALATAGLSFGAEKLLIKDFGGNIGPQEIQLYRLVQALSTLQKKTIENFLVGEGIVHRGGTAQYGGFLGMLASIGVPVAIDRVSKLLGKDMHVGVREVAGRFLPLRCRHQKKGERYARALSCVLWTMGDKTRQDKTRWLYLT